MKVLANQCVLKAIFPTTVFVDVNDENNERNGKRTEIELDFYSELHEDTLIYLKSVQHAIPDGCHACTRIVEKELKLIAEYLLEKVQVISFIYVTYKKCREH